MSNDSSTGGYLAPSASPAPIEGQTLNRFLQQIVVGITGLDPTLVRPRWQPEPPNMPAIDATWVAIGITNRKADTFAAIIRDPTGDGADTVQRHEEFDLLCSFYGPSADDTASLLREGLSIAQNREPLGLADMGLVGVSDTITAPSLVNDRWQYRLDMTVTIRRQIRRTYPVLNVLSAGITVTTDTAPPVTSTINISQ